MGSSGMKRKGRKHLPKVGTAPEREYALRHEQQAVATQMGLGGATGWVFWAAIVVLVALVVFAVLGLAFWF